MRAILILLAALAVACGSVHDRSECSASADCAAGSYCARTGDGSVCWPDAVAPAVSGVSVRCEEPCLRSSMLHVEATVSDDVELSGAEVSLDVGGPAIAMAPVGGTVWAADVPLVRFPFEHFTHDVVATVTARDGARNEGSAAAGAVHVTRLAWEKTLETGLPLTHPVIVADESVLTVATVAVANANHKLFFVTYDGTEMVSTVVGSGPITAAPLALGASVWVGSEDNKVYEVKKNSGGTWDAFQRADTGGPIRSSLGLTLDDRVLAASEIGRVYAVTSSGSPNSSLGPSYSLGPVTQPDGTVYAVGGAAVRRFTIVLGAPEMDPLFAVTLGSPVSVPLAIDGGLIVAASNGSDGLLKKVVASGGDPEHVATTAIPSGGVAILRDGSIVVPELTKTLSRWTASGAPFTGWQTLDLGGAARTPLVLESATPFVVSTANGAVHALRPDGTIAWTAQFGTAALQPGNIYTPPGQPPDTVLSIAYFAGADGVLHAVIVDGKLDGSAPWPKAFHDPQNTNRAGAQP